MEQLKELEDEEELEKEVLDEGDNHPLHHFGGMDGGSPKSKAQSKKNQESQEYYEKSLRRLQDYADNLKRRNEAQTKSILKSQIINAYLEESEYPFEAIF